MNLKPKKFRYPIRGHPLSKGLIGYWLMNEGSGTTVADLSGNHNQGTVIGPTWTAGKYGPTLLFAAASNNRVGFTNEIIGAGDCSIVALINPASIGETTGRILDNGKAIFFCAPTNSLSFTSNGATTLAYSANNAVPYGVWSHVVVTRKALEASSEANFYVNGRLSGTANQNSGLPVAGTVGLKIGTNSALTRDYDGKIEFVYIYNRVLTVSEVADLYCDPFVMFKREPIELWAAACSGGAHPGLSIPIAMHHYKQLRGAA